MLLATRSFFRDGRAIPGRGYRGFIALLLVAACTENPVAPELPPLTELPSDFGSTFVVEGSSTAPYTMLELRQAEGFRGFVAVNRAGQPVWYFRTSGSPFSFTRRRNGNLVLLDSGRGLLEVNRAGEVIHELAQEAAPGRRLHHDILATDRNTILFIAEEWQMWRGELLNGEAVWEWSPETGTVVKRWSSFDHFDPAVDWSGRSIRADWLHANALSRGARGNILLSLHHLNQVISIAPDFGSVEWRLGGVNGTIEVSDPFSGQHTAMEIQPSRVLMFDNGFERSDARYSRAVEYALDSQRAVKVWEWRPARDNWARVISSARRLANGNTLVTFGVPRDQPAGSTGPIEIYEVTRQGEVAWHLTVGGAVRSVYRGTPLFDL